MSNVDITDRSCALAFAASNRELKGREAHELYATLVEAGVASDGAAGTIHESISHLLCTIDPNAIKQKDGSGAECKFDTGGSGRGHSGARSCANPESSRPCLGLLDSGFARRRAPRNDNPET